MIENEVDFIVSTKKDKPNCLEHLLSEFLHFWVHLGILASLTLWRLFALFEAPFPFTWHSVLILLFDCLFWGVREHSCSTGVTGMDCLIGLNCLICLWASSQSSVPKIKWNHCEPYFTTTIQHTYQTSMEQHRKYSQNTSKQSSYEWIGCACFREEDGCKISKKNIK